jgi:hypothetical protein
MHHVETSFVARKGFAAALIAAPVSWLVAEFVSPALKADAVDQLSVVVAHPDRWYWYSFLLVAGCLAFVPAAVALSRVARSGGSRIGSIGGLLLAFGAIIGAADAMTQFIVWEMAKGEGLSEMAGLITRYDDSASANVFFMFGGLAWLIGAVMLTIGLTTHHNRVPAWAAAAFGLGAITNIVGFSINSIVTLGASAALLLIGAVPLVRVVVDGEADVTPSHLAVPAAA